MNKTIAEPDRLAYLDALGIAVWQLRGESGDAPEQQAIQDEVAPVPGDALPAGDWSSLRQAVSVCTLCALHESRTQTVFGVGNTQADLLVIGEAPGAEEDRRGEPFVGKAGKLLDEMLHAIGLDRNTVYISNILKCRPPGNRDPRVAEAASCRPYLDAQIGLLQPKVVLAVGRIAAQQLLGTDTPLGGLRARQHRLGDSGTPVIVTYHPAYLLREPSQKRKAWQDLCTVRALLRELTA